MDRVRTVDVSRLRSLGKQGPGEGQRRVNVCMIRHRINQGHRISRSSTFFFFPFIYNLFSVSPTDNFGCHHTVSHLVVNTGPPSPTHYTSILSLNEERDWKWSTRNDR